MKKRIVSLFTVMLMVILVGAMSTGCSKGGSSSSGGTTPSTTPSTVPSDGGNGGSTAGVLNGTWVGHYNGTGGEVVNFSFNISHTNGSSSFSGSDTWSNNMGSSGVDAVTGTISGSNVSLQESDTSCGRTISASGTVNGNTMSLTFSAPTTSGCGAISAAAVTFTKQ